MFNCTGIGVCEENIPFIPPLTQSLPTLRNTLLASIYELWCSDGNSGSFKKAGSYGSVSHFSLSERVLCL